MSLTNLQKLRLSIADKEKVKADEIVGVGNGIRTRWVLEMHPLKESSEVIAVDGVPQTEDTDYTLNIETGLLTFLSGHAPRDREVIEALTYGFYAFSDEDLNEILDLENNVIMIAAARCLRILAADAATFFTWTSGDERVDRSKICANFLKVAASLEARAKAIPYSGAAYWEVELEDFGEKEVLAKLDLTEYLDSVD